MKTDKRAILVTGGLTIGCPAGYDDDGGMSGGINSAGTAAGGTEGGSAEGEGEGEGNGPGNGPGSNGSEGGNTDGNPKYDVGAGGANFCMDEAAGIYCFDNTAYECGDSGNEISSTICTPD